MDLGRGREPWLLHSIAIFKIGKGDGYIDIIQNLRIPFLKISIQCADYALSAVTGKYQFWI